MSQKLHIAMVAAERVPLAKVGGLADVAGALSDVLAERGHTVSSFLPAYRSLEIPADATRTRILESVPVPLGNEIEHAAVDRIHLPDSKADVFVIDHLGEAKFFERDGIYVDPETGEEYPDTAERFLFFSRAVCESLKRLGRKVDVIHCNDFQTGFVPAFLRRLYASDPFFAETATLMSLHNVGFQGVYGSEALALAQVATDELRSGSPFEFYGSVNFLKVGIEFCDVLTTVSERYAEEIRTGPQYGFGLEGVLEGHADKLRGILNGIDTKTWNPELDPHLKARYSVGDLSGKAKNREWLSQETCWPPESDWPIVGMIARLYDQKGLDLIDEAADELLKMEARFVFLGTGDPKYVDRLNMLARKHPERIAARNEFDDPLAHRIEAGADLFLMPSKYEPCGLNQMISMRYGTIPIVRSTGGLADTVRDFDPESREGTGFVFHPYEAEAMVASLKRALAIYRQPNVWNALVANAMTQDFSWDSSATVYETAYRDAQAARARQRKKEASGSVS